MKKFSSLYILGFTCLRQKGRKKGQNKERKKTQSWAPNLRRNSCPQRRPPARVKRSCVWPRLPPSPASDSVLALLFPSRLEVSFFSWNLSLWRVSGDFWIGIWWSPLELSTSFCESSRGFSIRYAWILLTLVCLFVSCGWLLLCCLFCSCSVASLSVIGQLCVYEVFDSCFVCGMAFLLLLLLYTSFSEFFFGA